MITFKDLENFVTCANSKTLSEASEKLHMTQPSLSLGIKKLETELGYPLFLRSKDGLKLTPQGKNLLPDALNSLKSLDRIKGKRPIVKFKIGCHASVGLFVLGDFLKIMHKENSEIDFEIVTASSHEINKMAAKGEIDFGIVMNPISLQGLITKTIGEDEVAIWESKTRYQDKLIYNPQMLQATSIISRWKAAPEQAIDVSNLELAAFLADSGAGFGILPTQVVRVLNLELKKVPNTPTFKDHLALVCYPDMLKSPEGKIIFESLKKSYRYQ